MSCQAENLSGQNLKQEKKQPKIKSNRHSLTSADDSAKIDFFIFTLRFLFVFSSSLIQQILHHRLSFGYYYHNYYYYYYYCYCYYYSFLSCILSIGIGYTKRKHELSSANLAGPLLRSVSISNIDDYLRRSGSASSIHQANHPSIRVVFVLKRVHKSHRHPSAAESWVGLGCCLWSASHQDHTI